MKLDSDIYESTILGTNSVSGLRMEEEHIYIYTNYIVTVFTKYIFQFSWVLLNVNEKKNPFSAFIA